MNAGTHQRAPWRPLGNEEYPSVQMGNLLCSRYPGCFFRYIFSKLGLAFNFWLFSSWGPYNFNTCLITFIWLPRVLFRGPTPLGRILNWFVGICHEIKYVFFKCPIDFGEGKLRKFRSICQPVLLLAPFAKDLPSHLRHSSDVQHLLPGAAPWELSPLASPGDEVFRRLPQVSG